MYIYVDFNFIEIQGQDGDEMLIYYCLRGYDNMDHTCITVFLEAKLTKTVHVLQFTLFKQLISKIEYTFLQLHGKKGVMI